MNKNNNNNNNNKNKMSRRGFLSLGVVAAGSTFLTGCATSQMQTLESDVTKTTILDNSVKLLPDSSKKRIVIIGGGISGMAVASSIRNIKDNKNIEIVILEKNQQFHSCPGSNVLLSKTASEYTSEETMSAPAQWIFKYHTRKEDFSKTNDTILTGVEVLDGDTDKKIVLTNKGTVSYDSLIVATGIEYDYEGQFPNWNRQKIEMAKNLTPAGMMQDGGVEWENMSSRWENLIKEAKANPGKQFNIVINPTPKTSFDFKMNSKTLRRCPPAAGERTSMLASRIKKEGLTNLKIDFIIELEGKLGSKGAAFEQSWVQLGYCKDINKPSAGDIIRPIFNTRVVNIDFSKKTLETKTIVYDDMEDVMGYSKKSSFVSYDEAIIMAQQKTPVVVKKIFGKEPKLSDYGFEVSNLPNHFVLGDSQSTHPLPASGSMGMNISSIMANQVVSQLNGKFVKADYTKATNVCFSLVGENPNEGIKVEHTLTEGKKGIIKSKGAVPHPNGVYRSNTIAKEQASWLLSIGFLFNDEYRVKPNSVMES